jgi:ribosomal protein S18 acetylase RimI-like enzyme
MTHNTPTQTNLALRLPAGFSARPPTLDDVPMVVEFLNAHSTQWMGRNVTGIDGMRSEWTEPSVNLEKDVRLVFDEHSQLVGIVGAYSFPPYIRTFVQIVAHPEAYTLILYPELLVWAEARAHEWMNLAPADARFTMRLWVNSTDTPRVHFANQTDFTHIRNFYRMRIDLTTPDLVIPPAEFPPHLRLTTLAEEGRDQLVHYYRAMDEAFQDHWGYVKSPEEDDLREINHWIDNAGYVDINYFYMLKDGDEIAAICLCTPEMDNQPELGFVAELAVRRPWRKQGLALNLLYLAFARFKAEGKQAGVLYVDAENLSGALRLYKRAGMDVEEVNHIYELTLRDGIEYANQG